MTKRKWHLAERRRSNSTLGFLFSVLSSRRHPFSDIVLFPFYFFVRHSSPMHRARDPTRMGTRTRKASYPWPLRSRDDCNLHKLSFRFDDDVATAVRKRPKDRVLCVSHFRSSRYNIEFLTRRTKSCFISFTSSSWLSSRYIGNKKIK